VSESNVSGDRVSEDHPIRDQASLTSLTVRRMLIANRGEIAVRLIRACRDLDIETVLAHSEADRGSLAAELADQTVCIGPGPSDKSYLNIPNVVSAALITGCDALHPGYGFLAENAYLAEVCQHTDILFVGPPPTVMDQFSNKVAARRLMARAGLQVVPGSEDAVAGLDAARAAAAEVSYPVMLKAAAGGGGRGMRVATSDEEMVRLFPLVQAEAQASFGDAEIYVERMIADARHIEVQVAADVHGSTIHLGERECSLQRRHQKLLEEAPSAGLTPAQREAICCAAVRGAQYADYQSIGTMEFLVDREGRFYFIEMNTRLQVEHAVTEMVTGVDMVKLQIRIAERKPLGLTQEQVQARGHAIEARIVAEDPERDFAADHRPLQTYRAPGGPGVRVDSHLFAGYQPPPYYDSLLAKVVVWGQDRDEAMARLGRALRELRIDGPSTTVPYHLAVLADEDFRHGRVHTMWQPAGAGPAEEG
jgi:acetyl-CoA carboxylase biotin carboxylase subunit